MIHLIYYLLIGLIAGWLAGKVTEGHGFGVIGDLVVGVIGALIGGFLFGLIELHPSGFIGSLITSSIGAVIFLWLIRKFKHKTD